MKFLKQSKTSFYRCRFELFTVSLRQGCSIADNFLVTIDMKDLSIYISYYGDAKDDIEKVQMLAKYLNVGNVKLYVDSLHQTEIDQNGGYPYWIRKMQSADKIIMLITPKYLEVLLLLRLILDFKFLIYHFAILQHVISSRKYIMNYFSREARRVYLHLQPIVFANMRTETYKNIPFSL